MNIRNPRSALAAGTLVLAAFAASPASAQSDTLWDDLYRQALQRMEMMKMMDADQDHKVTRNEFMHHSDMMFERLDRNRDGALDEDEWTWPR